MSHQRGRCGDEYARVYQSQYDEHAGVYHCYISYVEIALVHHNVTSKEASLQILKPSRCNASNIMQTPVTETNDNLQ